MLVCQKIGAIKAEIKFQAENHVQRTLKILKTVTD